MSDKKHSVGHERNRCDLAVELDYLGCMTIESKYLQHSVIPWLTAQINLFPSNNRVLSSYVEINVKNNSLIAYRNQTEILLNHRLTKIFKLCKLPGDQSCFVYFYRKQGTAPTIYILHAFNTNKSNLVECLSDLQKQALNIHDQYKFQEEKIYEFKLCAKLENLQLSQVNDLNFIQNWFDSTKHLNENAKFVLKFTQVNLQLTGPGTKMIEKEYDCIVYLNNSILNENYLCVAFYNKLNENTITTLIFYSTNKELIDDVIKEYLSKVPSNMRIQQHMCSSCPMQQYCDLCENLNLFTTKPVEQYKIIMKVLQTSLTVSDHDYLYDCLNRGDISNLNMNEINSNIYQAKTNQLLVALIHKLCEMKQNQHLILNLKLKQQSDEDINEFSLMKNVINKSNMHNLDGNLSIEKQKIKRRNTLGTDVIRCDVNNNNNNHKIKLKVLNSILEENPFDPKIFEKMNSFLRKKINNGCSSTGRSSVRRRIFNKIFGASKTSSPSSFETNGKRNSKSPAELRQLWKKIISEQILLVKMDRQHRQVRSKLNGVDKNLNVNHEYIEVTQCLRKVDKKWDKYLERQDLKGSYDSNEIHQMLFEG